MQQSHEELKEKLVALYDGDTTGPSDTAANDELSKLTAAAKSLSPDFAKPAWSFAHHDEAVFPAFVGDYEVLDVLGTGGMGIVYKAKQKPPLSREVAVKVVRKDIATSDSLARFKNECMALARMDHPNVASVVDHGDDLEGQPYVVLELLDGMPVTECLRDRQLDLRQSLRVFVEICKGVAHAHACGVIHRDLKPSNVIAIPEDNEIRPKIIDFGIAKVIDVAEDERLTRTQQVFGTLEYVSPEVVEMGASIADARSDVYSLGCILHEILTGRPPIDLDSARSLGILEVMKTIRNSVVGKPSDSSADDAPGRFPRRSIVGDLDCITLHALQKEPRDRYQSPNELAADIERFLEFKPIQASPPSPGRLITKFLWRHRGLALAVGAVFVSLTGGLLFSISSYRRADCARRQAEVAQEDGARALALLSDASMLANAYDPEGKRRLASLGGRIEQVLNDADFRSPGPRCQLQVMLAASYRSLGRFESAQEVLLEAHGLVQKKDWATPTHRFQIAIMIAENALSLRQIDQAAAFVDEAMQIAEGDPDPRQRAKQRSQSQFVKANIFTVSGQLDEAAEVYGSVIADHGAESEIDQAMTLARAQVMLASILVRQGKSSEAYQHSLSGYEVYRKRYGLSQTQALMAGHNHAIILTTLGKTPEAIGVFREILEGRQRVLGDGHPDTLMTKTMLAQGLVKAEQIEEARQLYEEVLSTREDETSRAEVLALASKGLLKLQFSEQEFAEAETTATAHIRYSSLLYGNSSWRIQLAKNRLAMVYSKSGQHLRAATLAAEIYDSLVQDLGSEHQFTLVAARTAAESFQALGKVEQATRWREKANPNHSQRNLQAQPAPDS